MLQLYKNIKMLRMSNGWDQEYLAKKVGYADKSMISRIENGKVDLKQSQIMAFADAFNIPAGVLFGSSEDSFSASVIEKELIIAYRKVPESRREAVRTLLNVEERGNDEEMASSSAS